MWQFISNTLKFDKKPSKILKENVDKILSICILNESNKHLRLQSLNGFYYLLLFDNLIEQASLLNNLQPFLDQSLPNKNNYQYLAKLVWHSLWNSSNNLSFDNNLLEERFN